MIIKYKQYIKEYYEDDMDDFGYGIPDLEEIEEIEVGNVDLSTLNYKPNFVKEFNTQELKMLKSLAESFIRYNTMTKVKYENDATGGFITLNEAYNETKKGNNLLGGMCAHVSNGAINFIDKNYEKESPKFSINVANKMVMGVEDNTLSHAVILYNDLYIIDFTYAQYDKKAPIYTIYKYDDYYEKFWDNNYNMKK